MSNFLDDFPVALNCRECGHNFAKTVAQLKADKTLTCPACRKATDTEHARAQLVAAEKSVADFARSIRGIADKLKK